MKILIPILVEKRLPEIKEDEPFSPAVIVRYRKTNIPSDKPEFSALAFAYCDRSGRWDDATPEASIRFSPESHNKVVEWYEEREFESLFPDDDTSYRTAKNAGNGIIWKTAIHQEGQDFVKNYALRQLKK